MEQQSGRRGRPIPTEQRIGWTGKAPSRTYYFHKKMMIEKFLCLANYEVIHILPKNKGTQPDLLLSLKNQPNKQTKTQQVYLTHLRALKQKVTVIECVFGHVNATQLVLSSELAVVICLIKYIV